MGSNRGFDPTQPDWLTFTMKTCILIILAAILSGCATKGGFTRIGPERHPLAESAAVSVSAEPANQPCEVVAIVAAHHPKLGKATEALKRQARLSGANAIVDFKQECRFSGDTWVNEYFVEGKAVVIK